MQKFTTGLQIDAKTGNGPQQEYAIQNLKALNQMSPAQRLQWVVNFRSGNTPVKNVLTEDKYAIELRSGDIKSVSRNIEGTLGPIVTWAVHLGVTYRVSSGKVTSIVSSDAYKTWSIPLVDLDLVSKTAYVSSDGQGYVRAKFQLNDFSGTPGKLTIGIVAYSIAGNASGNLSYSNQWIE